jgi:hypothetical protein
LVDNLLDEYEVLSPLESPGEVLGTTLRAAGSIVLGTSAALFSDRATWDLDVGALGLFQTYNLLFGYPFDYDIASLVPSNLIQPPMQLPFEPGATWLIPAAHMR